MIGCRRCLLCLLVSCNILGDCEASNEKFYFINDNIQYGACCFIYYDDTSENE